MSSDIKDKGGMSDMSYILTWKRGPPESPLQVPEEEIILVEVVFFP